MTWTDLKNIFDIENKIFFDDIFNEECRSLLQIFFTYILVQPKNSRFKLNNKTKNMSIMFLNTFSNVNDIYLKSLKMINNDAKIVINFLKSNEHLQKTEFSVLIKDFAFIVRVFI